MASKTRSSPWCILCTDYLDIDDERKPVSGMLNPSYSVRDGLLEMFGVTVDDADVDNGSLCLLCYKCLLRAYVKYTTSMHDYHKQSEHEQKKNSSQGHSSFSTRKIRDAVPSGILAGLLNNRNTVATKVPNESTSAKTPGAKTMTESLCFLCNESFQRSSKGYEVRKPLTGTMNETYTVREGLLQIYGVTVNDSDLDNCFLCLPCHQNLFRACHNMNKNTEVTPVQTVFTKPAEGKDSRHSSLPIQKNPETNSRILEPEATNEVAGWTKLASTTNLANKRCYLCKSKFVERSKGYMRMPMKGDIRSKHYPCTIRDGLSQIFGVTVSDADCEKSFLCVKCYNALSSAIRSKMKVATVKCKVESCGDKEVGTPAQQQSNVSTGSKCPTLYKTVPWGPANIPENMRFSHKYCFLCNRRFLKRQTPLSCIFSQRPVKGNINPSYSIKEGLMHIFDVMVDDAACEKSSLCPPCFSNLQSAHRQVSLPIKPVEAPKLREMVHWQAVRRPKASTVRNLPQCYQAIYHVNMFNNYHFSVVIFY